MNKWDIHTSRTAVFLATGAILSGAPLTHAAATDLSNPVLYGATLRRAL